MGDLGGMSKVTSEELADCLEKLIQGIDNWNDSVQEIIGRYVNYEWNNLEEARKTLAKFRKTDE